MAVSKWVAWHEVAYIVHQWAVNRCTWCGQRVSRGLTALLLTVLVTACGGGGGGGGSSFTPAVNNSPQFTSGASASVAENTASSVYTASADDADGDTLSFSIDGGADAAQFNIAATSGDLSFATPPDFENPADADGDNVYEVDLAVSDGQGARTLQSVAITITDVVESSGTRYVDEVFANVDVQRAIQFATVDTPDGPQDLLMDVYQPSGDSLVDRPIMIAMSGGGFVGMDRLNVEPIARTFARRGYVAVSIDYRVLGRQPLDGDELAIAGTQAVHDLYGAVRFLRAEASGINQFGTNANQIFVSGESAGGVIAAIAATLDPTDTISLTVVADYLAANGGVYGEVGDNDAQASAIQGAMPLSGAILELASVDANSAPMYAAHEELDPVVPCGTTAEGSSGTGLIVSGACDIVPAYTAAGAVAELFLVANSSGHVSFTPQQRTQIYNGAATLFFNEVINAGN